MARICFSNQEIEKLVKSGLVKLESNPWALSEIKDLELSSRSKIINEVFIKYLSTLRFQKLYIIKKIISEVFIIYLLTLRFQKL